MRGVGMWASSKMQSKRIAVAGVLMGVVALAAACDPGWTSAALGTGDGSGTVPGSVAIPEADVTLSHAFATVDLGARGFLTYDSATCQIYRTDDGTTTLFAGNGQCGDTGDGGPAIDASLNVLLVPFGTGMMVDDQGNVVLSAGDDEVDGGVIRKIDASGTITRIPTAAAPGFDLMGVAPADGGLAYLLYNGTNEEASTYEIHKIDASGDDDVAATWTGDSSTLPRSFVAAGPDHWVVVEWGWTEGDGQIRVDIDHGTVTTTDLVNPPGVGATDRLLLDDADSAGNLYGFSLVDTEGGGYEWSGNRVIRIRPDGKVDVIAGSGAEDPETSRQMGSGTDLDLTVYAVSATRNDNLLIASGHNVYRMIDAAHAPAFVPAGS